MELDQFRDVDLVIDYANYTFIEKQFVSQGDYKGRTLTVLVTNKGVVGEVPGLMLNLNWHNVASGLTDLSAFSVLDKANSIYRIEYPQHMMTPGRVIASIQVIQNGKVTNLKQFELTVQELAGQAVGIVDKAEFSALVAVLADSNKFRTDIDTLDSVKADKTSLSTTNKKVDTLSTGKVDRNGTGQVNYAMLAQDVREKFTGDQVAVVGEKAVASVNVSKITKAKLLSNESNDLLYIDFEYGEIANDGSIANDKPIRIYSDLIFTGNKKLYFDLYENYRFALAKYSQNGFNMSGFTQDIVNSGFDLSNFNDTTSVRVYLAKPDNSEFTQSDLDLISQNTYVVDDNVLTWTHDLGKFGLKDNSFNYNRGSLKNNAGVVETTTDINRIYTESFIPDDVYFDFTNLSTEFFVHYFIADEFNNLITTNNAWDQAAKVDLTEYAGKKLIFHVKNSVNEPVDFKTIDVIKNSIVFNPINATGAGARNSEVWVDGSTSSSGDGTRSNPYKTIQQGVDSGAEVINVRNGVYKGKILSTDEKERLEIRCVPETDYAYQGENKKLDRQGVVIDNTTKLNLTLDASTGLYKKSWTSSTDNRIYRLFVSKTINILDNKSDRSVGYNCTLWENTNDYDTDLRLLPVLTLAECQATESSFFYDGTNIYVNPTNGTIENKTYQLLDDIENPIKISNVRNLKMNDIIVIGGYQNCVELRSVNDFELTRCEAHRSATDNGFSADWCNGKFYFCEATQHRNDGFNFHKFGDTHLFDCFGHHCFDDGNSHHDGCTGSIHGGEWSYNGKGGCSPTYGAKVDIYNTYCHHNQYGMYVISSEDRTWRTVRHGNNVVLNNDLQDYLISRTTVIDIQNIYDSVDAKDGLDQNMFTIERTQ